MTAARDGAAGRVAAARSDYGSSKPRTRDSGLTMAKRPRVRAKTARPACDATGEPSGGATIVDWTDGCKKGHPARRWCLSVQCPLKDRFESTTGLIPVTGTPHEAHELPSKIGDRVRARRVSRVLQGVCLRLGKPDQSIVTEFLEDSLQ